MRSVPWGRGGPAHVPDDAGARAGPIRYDRGQRLSREDLDRGDAGHRDDEHNQGCAGEVAPAGAAVTRARPQPGQDVLPWAFPADCRLSVVVAWPPAARSSAAQAGDGIGRAAIVPARRAGGGLRSRVALPASPPVAERGEHLGLRIVGPLGPAARLSLVQLSGPVMLAQRSRRGAIASQWRNLVRPCPADPLVD